MEDELCLAVKGGKAEVGGVGAIARCMLVKGRKASGSP